VRPNAVLIRPRFVQSSRSRAQHKEIWSAAGHPCGALLRYGVISLFLVTCRAQNFSVGFTAGTPLTNAFETRSVGVPPIASYSQSKDYVVGLTLEYALPGNFSVEGDALYRELHLEVGLGGLNRVNSVSPSPVVTWELPLMLKYRFRWWKANPFVETGPAFRPTSNLNANPSHYGVEAGIGAAMHWKQFEIAPMVRYSRWIHDRAFQNFAESKSDQLELLIGVSSRPRSPWHPLSRRIALGMMLGTTLFHDVPTSSSVIHSPVPASATTYASGSDVAFIGPALEAVLVKSFFLEVDAFYHPIVVSRRSVLSNGEVIDLFSGVEGRTFEFPVLGKYKFGTARFKPFVEAGPSFRLLTENSSLFGISAGVGFEMGLRSLRIAPALRFTHWGRQGSHSPSAAVIPNQVEFAADFLL